MKKIYYNIRRIISNICYHIRKKFNLPDPVEFKYVDLVFENCDIVRIPSRLIDKLLIRDIGKDIFTTYYQQFITLNKCQEFSITIKNEGLKIETYFQKSFKSDLNNSLERHLKVFKDITHIDVKPNRGKSIYIGVPFETETELDDLNLLQETVFEDDTFTISCIAGNCPIHCTTLLRA